jgi:putative chitinase
MPQFNLTKFFIAYGKAFGAIQPLQESGLRFLLGKVASDPAWPADLRFIAYFLATISHETGIRRKGVLQSFQPIAEQRARPGSRGRANQDRYWLTNFYGRGYVQITWDYNYKKFGILNTPEKALEPETAYRIASQGMLKGMFTGKKLSHYFSDTKEDFKNARRIINGLDRADHVASIARKIQACLSLALEKEPATQPDSMTTASEVLTPLPTAETSSQSSLTDKAKSAIASYQSTDEGVKALVGRVIQKAWVGVSGLVAVVQSNPIKTAIAVLVLVLGFYVIHQYCRRQDQKTLAKLSNK